LAKAHEKIKNQESIIKSHNSSVQTKDENIIELER